MTKEDFEQMKNEAMERIQKRHDELFAEIEKIQTRKHELNSTYSEKLNEIDRQLKKLEES